MLAESNLFEFLCYFYKKLTCRLPCLVFLLLALFNCSVISQNNVGHFERIMPPSPNAAAFAQYGEVPVGMYTGTPNVEVPLFELTGKQLTHPIALSYHSGGIKVDEVASNVGLGWVLNAGGVITRSVRGLPDDDQFGFLNFYFDPSDSNDPNYAFNMQETAKGLRDTEPDEFFFNVNGLSGKFFLDNTGNVHLTPYQDVKVTHDVNLTEWTIITPDGVTYKFGGTAATEVSTITTDCGDSPPGLTAKSAWYLIEIKHPTGDLITFTYDISGSSAYVTGVNQSSNTSLYAYEACNGVSICQATPSLSICLSTLAFNTVRLTSIVSAHYNTSLIYSSRDDLASAYKVDEVLIKDKSQTLLKKFVFSYSYFQSANCPPNVPCGETKRLKLLSVRECDAGGSCLPSFSFNYTTDVNSNLNLPHRLSYKQDHWGFANANTTSTLLPTDPDKINSGNRKADPQMSKSCLLEKITYPTGGYTQFEYEAHKAGYKVNTNYPVNDSTTTTTTTTVTSDARNASQPIYQSKIIHIPAQQTVNVYRRLCPCPPGSNSDDYARIVDLQTNAVVYQMAHEEPLCLTSPQYVSVNLPSGDYKVETYASVGVWTYISFNHTEYVFQSNNLSLGGVRIKSITQNDGVGGPNVVKSYEYNEFSDPLRSSGILITPPHYRYVSKVCALCTGTPGSPAPYCAACTYNALGSSSKAPLGMSHGSHIVYRNVTVKNGLNGEGGKSEHVFTYFDEGFGGGFPIGPNSSKDWQRGLPLAQSDYKYTNGQYTLVKSKNIEYDFRSDAAPNCYKGEGHIIVFYPANPNAFPVPPTNYRRKTYILTSRWYSVKKETYWNDGVTTEVHYAFDETNGRHTLPIEVKTQNSDGKWQRTTTLYSKDMHGSVDPAIQLLIQKNMIVPLEARSEYGNTGAWILQGGEKRTYAVFNLNVGSGNFNCPLLYQAYRILPTGATDLQYTIQEYFSDGMIKKVLNSGYTTPLEFSWSNGLIAQSKYAGFIENYEYYTHRKLLKKITAIDGQITEFTYDGYQRLFELKERFEVSTPRRLTTFTYNYGGAANNYIQNQISLNDFGQTSITQYARSYVDGLGRPRQTVKKDSPSGADVAVESVAYDAVGRPYRKYVPILGTGSSMSFIPFSGAYEQLSYESSPSGRVVNTTKVPDNFISTVAYGANTSTEVLLHNPASGSTAYFAANTLVKETTTDPDGKTNILYKDKLGRKVLERRVLQSSPVQYADTYHVYDDKGNLVFIVPPGAANTNSPLCFKFEYDSENRLWKKTIPNAGVTEYAYDARDRMIAMRDANLTAQGLWLRTTYDDYDRPLITGFATSSTGTISAANTLTTTTYGTLPHEIDKVKTTSVKILNNTGSTLNTATHLNTTFAYDLWGRVTNMTGNNHFNQTDNVANTYDRKSVDWLGTKTRTHSSPYGNRTILEQFYYDNYGKPTAHFHTLDNFPTQYLAGFVYDHRDRMITKRLHNSNISGKFLQEVNYQYNNWDWLTHINDPDAGLSSGPLITVCPPEPENPGGGSALQEDTCVSEQQVAFDSPVDAIGNIKGYLAFGAERLSESLPNNFVLGIRYDRFAVDGQVQTVDVLVKNTIYPDSAALAPEEAAATPDTVFWLLPDTVVIIQQDQTAARAAFEAVIYAGLLDFGLIDAPLAALGTAAVDAFNLFADDAGVQIAEAGSPVSTDLFHLRLYYETANPTISAPAQKNGNISWMKWRVAGRDRQFYGLSYDNLDRLTAARYAEMNQFGTYRLDPLFSTSNLTYDLRGNIKTMHNRGLTSGTGCFNNVFIDQLTYTYDLSNTGNKLLSVSDASGSTQGFKPGAGAGYAYDANGNLTSDSYKGITAILYNHLNLPYRITFNTGHTLEWIYSATGEQLRKVHKQGATTLLTQDYSGGIEYRNAALEAVYHAEGRITPQVEGIRHEYTLTDHLGNGRVYFADRNGDGVGTAGDILQDEHYYPFGLRISDPRRSAG
ncbi:MAG: DUF6443 domain-containing protein, partial [Saprospiraceae bacterium]|nr:DUF6443 domain-containing protein [Saprospiraceae bacterium]